MVPEAVWASGSYTARIPKPPEHVDGAKYELGKNLVLGKAAPSGAAANAAVQRTRLQTLQSKLPKKVQAGTDLTALAGKLSTKEEDALQYYIQVRYKVK